MMKKISLLIMLSCCGQLLAQQVLIDRGTRVNELWCFPLSTDTLTYLYLPSRARLALDEDKDPRFSFMRYITEKRSAEASAHTITEAGGGAIMTFLILYDTPEKQIKGAEVKLRKKLKNEDINIRGPVVFDKGRYILISSILTRDKSKEERKLLAVGEAPVLENSSLAFSFDLSPLNSKLMLENFNMDTPDISFVFELSFSGLSESYDATLEIDWSEVRKNEHFNDKGSGTFWSYDIEKGFDDLLTSKAIRLTTAGSNKAMEELLTATYNKLLNLMFNPVEAKETPGQQQDNLTEAVSKAAKAGKPHGKRRLGFSSSYRLKTMSIEGSSTLYFKGRETIHLNHFITFNIGDLYQKYGKDERFFRDVPLWDPAFQQREVYVGIDGSLEKEFENMLNSVTVTLRKQHLNGAETLADILISKESFKNYEGKLSMYYLNQGDTVQTDWLNYQYKTNWKFKGGGGYESSWQTDNASMVNLFVPFKRKTIYLEGDLSRLEEKGIRAVSVQISYPFFDRVKQHRVTLRPDDELSKKALEITLPDTVEDVHYKIAWIRKDAPVQEIEGIDNYGIIFIDEIPEQQ